MACVPSQTRCELMRVSSFSSTRIHCARVRNLQPQQLLHRQAVGEVVGHGAEIVDAVGQRHDLLVELRLAGLLDAGVQVADVGHDAHDGFAIDLQHQAQHAVRRRMLRAHVQDHRLVLRPRLQRRGRWSHVRHALAVALDGIILAQRMAFPVFRHHDARQVRMSVEANAEQVEDLALEEICARPDRTSANRRWHRRR